MNNLQEEEFHLWIIENTALGHICESDYILSFHENMQ